MPKERDLLHDIAARTLHRAVLRIRLDAVFQSLALLRCDGEKRDGSLFNILASALWARDVALVVLAEGENYLK